MKALLSRIARRQVQRVYSSRPVRGLRSRIQSAVRGPDVEIFHKAAHRDVDLIAYFGDGPEKLYQVTQWMPVFEDLNQYHRVAIVVRNQETARRLAPQSRLPIVFVRSFDNLIDLYNAHDYRLCLYVNNGVTNFQSLSHARMIHVHINHGESDKPSMVSNQAKAYDRIFVAGPAAVERHKRHLFDFDDSKLVTVGRPQLDLPRKASLPPSARPTVMYAPTWEGENDSNNFTSVDIFGSRIVKALLEIPGVRVVYKPHPRIETSDNDTVRAADRQIRTLVETTEADREPGETLSGSVEGQQEITEADESAENPRHLVACHGDILDMFSAVDLLVTDISSVALDFLYLHPERPLIVADRRSDVAARTAPSPITRVVPVVDANTVDNLGRLFTGALNSDRSAEKRTAVRAYYFGDGEDGSSTQALHDAITALLDGRADELRDDPPQPSDS